MRVFVTGATGFVGRYVVGELLSRGFEVYAGVRDISKFGALFAGRLTSVVTDFTNRDSIGNALSAAMPDAIVHLIGIIAESRSKGITFDAAHRQIAVDLYAAAKELGIKRAVHMSALGVHPDAPSHYHRTKLAAEQYLRTSGLSYTIFRPSLIIGPEQKLFSDMRRFAGIVPVIPLPGGGSHKMQPVDVRDVACSLAASLEQDATSNRVYELCGPDVMSFREMLEAIFSIWESSVYFLNMPKSIMSAAGRVAETIMDNPPLSSDLIRMMWKDNVCGLYGDALTDGVRSVCNREPASFVESLKWALA
ncbi:MAG TPA: complex I NDUFA9 subunit family protein [Dissulfurispiraceae bacterium]|nr:complex I NDUFA9 subunit family protein [Dissulfurispiraceae bacterium]